MIRYSHYHVFILFPILALGWAGCALTRGTTAAPVDAAQSAIEEELEDLQRGVEASYDRERAIADRLRDLEEGRAHLLEEMEMLREEFASLQRQVEGEEIEVWEPPPDSTPVLSRKPFDVLQIYNKALSDYRNRRYDEALGQYRQIIEIAPDSDWADNAQYWIGECYYGLAKYELALMEFSKVFTYAKTTKADHAQIKIGYCHMNLGEGQKALKAFQKLLDEYPESDKIDEALKEMEYLGGP